MSKMKRRSVILLLVNANIISILLARDSDGPTDADASTVTREYDDRKT